MGGGQLSDSNIRTLFNQVARQYPGQWVALACGPEPCIVGVGKDAESAMADARSKGHAPGVVIQVTSAKPAENL